MAERRIATTTRILSTAADLFSGHAYADVSVDEIAREAGITKMTLYQHFRSKDALAVECLRMRLKKREEMVEDVLAGLDPGADPLLALFEWLEGWVAPERFKGCSFVKAVHELSGVVPEVEQIALEAKQKMRERFTTLARRSGRKHARQLGQELALIFEGAQSLALVERSAQPARVAKRIARLLLKA